MNVLTERQQQIVDFIGDFYAENYVGPTVREIQEQFGFASPQAVTGHLKALVMKDAITVYEKTARGILPKVRTVKVQCPCCKKQFAHEIT